MQDRVIRVLLVMVMSGLMLPGITLARTDGEARNVVLNAVEDTIRLEGYHLTLKVDDLIKITEIDGFGVSVSHSTQTTEGDVANNGDRRFTRQLLSSANFEDAVESALTFEQIVSGGETYVNFQIEDTNERMLDIQPGWWQYERLLESVEGIITGLSIQQDVQIDMPLETLFRDDTISLVSELAPQVNEGINLRMFDVELNALQLLLEASPGIQEELEQLFAESEDLLAASEITAIYQLWIGANDGLVYRGKGEQRSVIPYATTGNSSVLDFDLDRSVTMEFTVSQHGEAVDIAPPDEDLLNE